MNYQLAMFYGAPPAIFSKAKALRNRMTGAERLLWEKLNNKKSGYKFRRQHPISMFIVDFYCHALKLVVEVDGGIHNLPEQIEYDKAREGELEVLGLRVLRFTNEAVEENVDTVVEKIMAVMQQIEALRTH